MLEHLRPLYAKQFRCLGSACDDNCCRNWEVPIDKGAYERFQNNPSLRPRMQEYFSRTPEGESTGRYALIKLTNSSRCPFLSEDRLCTLQQQYGSQYLGEVCATYPRNPHRIEGHLEQPLSLSCIEAARLVLLNPQLLPRFQSRKTAYQKFLLMPDRAVPQGSRKFRYFWEVREFSLILVQDCSYPLWERMFLLGMFCQRLGEILARGQFGLVPKLLHEHAEIAFSGKLRAEMDAIPIRASAQLQMVIEVALSYLRRTKRELCAINDRIGDLLQTIGYAPGCDFADCVDRYQEAFSRYYQPFIEQHPYLLENYLINHIFRVVFPFGQFPEKVFERPQREFLLLCLEFAVLKGLLIGAAGRYRESLTQDRVVKVVQTMAKSIEHDPTLGNVLNWRGLSDSGCIAALLKN